MKELIVQSHDFEKAKKELKEFSEKIPKELKLGKLDSEKEISEFVSDFVLGRGIGKDHIVKGKEINELIDKIQDNLKDINEIHIEFIKQVGYVYEALKSLDKEYIGGIVVAVNTATKACEEAKTAQKDIKKTVENQKKMIQVLQKFKKDLEVIQHINDVDKIWDDTASNIEEIGELWKRNQESDEIIETLSKNQKGLLTEIKKLPGIESIIETEQRKIEELETLKANLEKIEHIEDIDVIWDETENHTQKITNIEKSVENLDASMTEQEEKVKELQEEREKIDEIKHLEDVDVLWEDVQKSDKEIETLSKNQKELLTEIKRLPKIESIIETGQKKVKKLEVLKTNLEKIEHIEDIDVIWDETENHTQKITNIEKSVENLDASMTEQEEKVKELQEEREKIDEIKHLEDVDVLWEDVQKSDKEIETLSKNQKELLTEIKRLPKIESIIETGQKKVKKLEVLKTNLEKIEHIEDIDVIWDEIENHKQKITNIEKNIENLEKENQGLIGNIEKIKNESDKKIKTAYILAGSSMGLAIVELIIMVTRLM